MNTPSNPENSVAAITPPWDPIKVRDLVRHAQSSGQHPALLELGKQEAASFRAFLTEAYGEEGTLTLKDTYYLGLVVTIVDVWSRLAVRGTKAHDAWAGELAPLWSDRPHQAA
jgi:hypothetical protein